MDGKFLYYIFAILLEQIQVGLCRVKLMNNDSQFLENLCSLNKFNMYMYMFCTCNSGPHHQKGCHHWSKQYCIYPILKYKKK